MVNIWLVRHATTAQVNLRLSGRAPGVHLNEVGVREAAMLGERFRALELVAIYSSPLDRAVETATPMAVRTGAPMETSPLLTEIDFGAWTGRTFDDLADTPEWRTFNTCPDRAVIPGGESLEDVAARGAHALDAVTRLHRHGHVAVVSHGDVIRLTLARLLSIPVNAFRRLVVEPASATCVRVDGHHVSLVRLNEPVGAPLAKDSATP